MRVYCSTFLTIETSLFRASENFRLFQGMHILLAEDNETNRKVAAKMVESLGHTVEVVENGFEAVEKAVAGKFEVILMDVQMPIVDGLEASRRIRKAYEERSSRPRIIAVTANALLGDRETCLDAGMDDYIAKPLRLAALKRALEVVTESQSEDASGSGSLVDEEQLLGVIDAGDPECIEIFEEFCESIPESIEVIATGVTASDWGAVAAKGHQLKGAAATMGFVALADWAAKVETLSQSGGFALPDGWQEGLLQLVAQTRGVADGLLKS